MNEQSTIVQFISTLTSWIANQISKKCKHTTVCSDWFFRFSFRFAEFYTCDGCKFVIFAPTIYTPQNSYLIRTNFRADLISRIWHRFISRVLIFAQRSKTNFRAYLFSLTGIFSNLNLSKYFKGNRFWLESH